MRKKSEPAPNIKDLHRRAFVYARQNPAAATLILELLDAYIGQGKRAKAAEDQILVLERELDYIAPQQGRPVPWWYHYTRMIWRP